MVSKRSRGLDSDQIAGLRSAVEHGKRPRVVVSGPQFTTGTRATVVRVGDPDVDGADFITVRVIVDGSVDLLPFAASELSLPGAPSPRSRRAPTAAGPNAAGPNAAGPNAAGPNAAVPAAPPSSTAPAEPAPAKPDAETDAAGTAERARGGRRGLTGVTAAAPANSLRSDSADGRKIRPRRPGAVPAVQIAISSTEDGWQVEVRRGSRVAVKRTDVSPGAVSAVAEALSITELAVAVGEVNDAARLAVEQRAAQLRTELAELEAALARHRQPS